MTAALLITLRETLEASLIVGIVLAYLHHIQHRFYGVWVWLGVLAGVLFSLFAAFALRALSMGFSGATEEIYEGVMMITAAALISWMILWMIRQKHAIRRDIELKVSRHIERQEVWGIFFLTFLSTAREGIETVIFLQAAVLQAGHSLQLFGGLMGVAIAVVMSWLLFRSVVHLPLRQFFTVTSVLLILFAAGLLAHGVHELEELGLLPPLIEHVWDMNFLIAEDGAIGGILKGLFGYNGNPSLLEVMTYLSYILVISSIWRKRERENQAY